MVERRLRDRLAEFALHLDDGNVARRSLARWPALREEHGEEDDAEMAMFLPHLIHDRTTRSGKTPFQRFLEEHGKELGPIERESLERLHQGRWGLFEVTRVLPGRAVELTDLSNGETVELRDFSASSALQRWELVLTRIYPSRGAWVGDGALLPLGPELRPEVEKALVKLGLPLNSSGFESALRRRLPEVHETLRQLANRPAFDRVVTHEGDPVAAATATYSCDNPQRFIAALEAHPDIYPTEPDSEGQVFNWARPESALLLRSPTRSGNELLSAVYLIDPEATGSVAEDRLVNLGTVTVRGTTIDLECLSESRLSRLEELVRSFGVGIRLHQQSVEPVDVRSVSTSGSRGARRAPREEKAEVDPAVAERVRRDMAEQYLRTWPDSKLPALEGLTPREAARDPRRRPALVALLKMLEVDAGRSGGGLLPEDVRHLVRDLGISELFRDAERSQAA